MDWNCFNNHFTLERSQTFIEQIVLTGEKFAKVSVKDDWRAEHVNQQASIILIPTSTYHKLALKWAFFTFDDKIRVNHKIRSYDAITEQQFEVKIKLNSRSSSVIVRAPFYSEFDEYGFPTNQWGTYQEINWFEETEELSWTKIWRSLWTAYGTLRPFLKNQSLTLTDKIAVTNFQSIRTAP